MVDVETIIFGILCIWNTLWLVFFIYKFKQIKELLNIKDYIGVLGLYTLVLGLFIFIVFFDIGARAFTTLGALFLIAGFIILLNWVIWSIINIIRKVEEIKENIAIIGYIIMVFIFFFYGINSDISSDLEYLIFSIIIFILFFFWSGTMMYTLINVDKFRENKIKEKKIKVPIVAEQVDIKKRDEILDCPMCKNKLSDKLRERLSKGRSTFCTYCGSEIE